MMQCNDINELMMDFLYQELEEPRAEAFRLHVASCSRCNSELASLERTRDALRDLPDAEPPQAVTARLLHEAARHAPKPETDEERPGFFAWLAGLFRPMMAHPAWTAAASLLIVMGLTGYLLVTGKLDEKSQMAPATEAERSGHAMSPAATPPAAAPDPAIASNLEGADSPALALETAPRGAEVVLDGTKDRTGRVVSPEEQGVLGGARTGGKARLVGGQGGAGGAGVVEGDELEDKRDAPRGLLRVDTPADDGYLGGTIANPASGEEGSVAQPAKEEKAAKREEAKPVWRAEPTESEDFDDDVAEAEPAPASAPSPSPPPPPPARKPTEPAAESPTTSTTRQAPAAPAPRPAQATPERTNTTTTKKKNVSRDENARSAEDPKAKQKEQAYKEKLYKDAKTAAMSNQCGLSRTLRDQIQKIDSDYYNRSVAKDSVFAPCDNKLRDAQNRQRMKAPAEVRTIDADSAPAPESPSAADEAK